VTGLGLDAVGLSVNKRGQIEVDDHFRTKVPSIYAIGDCIPGENDLRSGYLQDWKVHPGTVLEGGST
jgi:pyruvate/2-oxoglutarate dehydrogenase complex dihydrolipoamide dehydrogenase (E3) component